MIVYALWDGGAGYSSPAIPDHVERFDSLADAKDAFYARHMGAVIRCPFAYVNREPISVYTPLTDASARMQVFFYDPTDERDPYPDRIITFGPRGGIRVERC